MTDGYRWNQIWDLFHRALELPASDRHAFLQRACGEDQDLRREVESLLESHEVAPEFLYEPETVQAELDSLPDPMIGQQVGPYRIRAVIAQGGMGTVYEAEQQGEITRKVAVKVIKAGMDTREVVARFDMERQAPTLPPSTTPG